MEATTEVPREKLRQIIEKNGEEILQDYDRVEGLLRDHCGSYRKEISALVGALHERVPLELKSSWQTAMTPEAMRARLVQRLEDNRGLAPEVAEWAVEAWSFALGVGLGRKSDRLDSEVLGQSKTKRTSAFGGATGLEGAEPGGGSAQGFSGSFQDSKASSDRRISDIERGGVNGDRAGGAAAGIVGTGLLATGEQKKKAGMGVGAVALLAIAVFAFGHKPAPTPVPTPTPIPTPQPQQQQPPPQQQAPQPVQKTVTPVPEEKKQVVPQPIAVQPALPMIPAGTAIDIRLNQGFNSDEVEVGQTFTATVATPLVVNGKVVVAQGADATIRVVSVDRAGKLTGKSVMQLALVQVTAGSKRYQISSSAKAIEGKEQIAEAGKRIGVGGAIGAGVGFIGGKLFHHGGAGAATGAGAGAVVGAATTKPQPAIAKAETVIKFRIARAVKS